MGRFDGKVAVVTGAASGLGEAVARIMAEDGASVVLADVVDERGAAVAKSIVTAGGEASFVHTDVRDAAQVQACVAASVRDYGRLDFMIANAGVTGTGSQKRIEDVTEDEWGFVQDVNLGGVYRSMKFAIPAIRDSGGGAIVATSSASALGRVGATLAAYASSKAGIIALVRYAAYEVINEGIRVNCVLPGAMTTRLSYSAFGPGGPSPEEEAALLERQRVGRQSYAERNRDLGRFADPSEVAKVTAFLCSEEASFVTGHSMVADGGYLLQFP